MGSPADDIPDLERLMRDVLRDVLASRLGPQWLDETSARVRAGIERAADIARRRRPGETLRDNWEAVGLSEMDAMLRSTWERLDGALENLWSNLNEATVDLDRLTAYRGKNLHAVGPPNAQITVTEVAAMILRLRVGLEGLRRQLMHDEGD